MDIRLLNVTALIGPNIYVAHQAIKGEIDFPGGTTVPVPTLRHALHGILSANALFSTQTVAAPDTPSIAALISDLAETLQNTAGASLDSGQGTPSYGPNIVLCRCHESATGLAALKTSITLTNLALHSIRSSPAIPPDLQAQAKQHIDSFLDTARFLQLDQTTRDIAAAARARGIPVRRLSASARFLQLGQGERQLHVFESSTDETSYVGSKISHNKIVTHQLLRSLGIPTPEQNSIGSMEHALTVARRMGFPLVVKPSHGAKSTAVTIDIRDEPTLKAAIIKADRSQLGTVLVERHIPGDGYRLLVVGGKLLTAARVVPTHVTGDGTSSIEQLVAHANEDPRRGKGFSREMVLISLDEETDRFLATQHLQRSSIPPAGQLIYLNNIANIGTGGIAHDVTAMAHPEVHEMASLISKVMKLDIMGLDYITTDISRPPGETGGAICDVNATPGLRTHWVAGSDKREILNAILDLKFSTHNGRIPIIAICGAEAQHIELAEQIARRLSERGTATAYASPNGVELRGKQVRNGPLSNAEMTEAVLLHPDVQGAVFAYDGNSLRAIGLPIDRCDVMAIPTTLAHDDKMPEPDMEWLARTADHIIALNCSTEANASALDKTVGTVVNVLRELTQGNSSYRHVS